MIVVKVYHMTNDQDHSNLLRWYTNSHTKLLTNFSEHDQSVCIICIYKSVNDTSHVKKGLRALPVSNGGQYRASMPMTVKLSQTDF